MAVLKVPSDLTDYLHTNHFAHWSVFGCICSKCYWNL